MTRQRRVDGQLSRADSEVQTFRVGSTQIVDAGLGRRPVTGASYGPGWPAELAAAERGKIRTGPLRLVPDNTIPREKHPGRVAHLSRFLQA